MSGESVCKCGRNLALTCLHCDAIDDAAGEAEDRERDVRIQKDVDAALREALGPCWNHLWGPNLEQLGHLVDLDAKRAEKAEAEVERLRAVLTVLEHYGACGIAEDGCVACLTAVPEIEGQYTIAMSLADEHLPLCPIGRALEQATTSAKPTNSGKTEL